MARKRRTFQIENEAPESDTDSMENSDESAAAAQSRSRKKRRGPAPPAVGGPRPIVAIVGRPNVGKSTLFNRLAGRHIAIVEDIPGVTRDRHYADAQILGREIILIDTGGFDPESDDPMAESIARQVRIALDEADLIVCVLDATQDPVSADREAVRLLRSTKKPVIFVANKADSKKQALEGNAHYALGIAELFPVSALHGGGLGELEEEIANGLPPLREGEDDFEDDIPRIAIVGRPNAGKSSLVNRLLGEERQIVDNRPGTTMDSIDALLERGDEKFVLIDTAGIRRKRSVEGGIEGLSVLQAIRALERADVAVLMIDGALGPAEQDAKIAGLVSDRGCALVIALNKTDLMTEEELRRATTRAKEILNFVSWALVVPLSAKSGKGTQKLMGAVKAAVAERRKRVATAEMNRFFEEVIDRHPPPTQGGKAVRLLFITQARVDPPSFVAVSNFPESVHFSYQRYVVNQIRKRFGFDGTPIRVFYRKKKRGR